MARVKFNRAIEDIRGSLDGWTFRRMFGHSRVSPKPDSLPRARGAAEAATNDRFRKAVQAARSAPPEMVVRYDERARKENKSRFSIRTRDYMVPPKITVVCLNCYAGRPGEPIFVIARDDFEVKDVSVMIRQRDGVVVEAGKATLGKADVFRYDATASVSAGTELKIEITATDWPGNVTRWQGDLVTS